MVKASDIYKYMCELAPMELKMDFDNPGFLVGDKEQELSKCLVSLDITSDVIKEAVEKGCGLIVSHHPVIWYEMKSLCTDDMQAKRVMELIRNGISAICMHTNLDIANGGVNDVLCDRLELENRDVFIASEGFENTGLGRIEEYKKEYNIPQKTSKSIIKLFNRAKIMNTIIGILGNDLKISTLFYRSNSHITIRISISVL